MVSIDPDQVSVLDSNTLFGALVANLGDADWVEFARDHWEEYFRRSEALLTDKQRRFILGLVEYSGENPRQQRYQIRQRIRRRFTDGLTDISLLDELDENSKDDISDRLGTDGLVAVAANLLTFIYSVTGQRELLKQAVRKAVYDAESSEPSLGEAEAEPRNVTVEIDVEYEPDYEGLQHKYQEGGIASLKPHEVGHLVLDRRLNPEDLEDYYDGNESLPGNDLFAGTEGLSMRRYTDKESDGEESKE